jgi:hypothetical protein
VGGLQVSTLGAFPGPETNILSYSSSVCRSRCSFMCLCGKGCACLLEPTRCGPRTGAFIFAPIFAAPDVSAAAATPVAAVTAAVVTSAAAAATIVAARVRAGRRPAVLA